MKKNLLIAALALCSVGATAQIADNSICPDWTGTDINGNSHNLYSLLDSGYTVFVDVSATWCAPCWAYHNTHALENLYNQYGPGTAQNKVRVFFIEGQSGNTAAQITGTSSPSNACSSQDAATYYHGCTRGDWTAGTPYPIIDDASIGDLLQITYFPTVFKICPNRVITTMTQPTTSEMWNSVSSCQSATSPSDGTLLPAMGSLKTCQGSGVDLVARLQNLGTSPMTSATIEARQGTTVLGTTNWTGTLNTYDVANVTVGNFVAQNSGTITYQITSTDDNATNNNSTQSLSTSNTVAPSTNVTFEIKTDNYGSETRWKLFNPDGTIFAQGGPYTNATSSNPPVAHTYNWALTDVTCYKLQVTDAYGDGMCCNYGNGYYKVMVDGNIVLQGGQFASEDNKLFKTDAASGIADNELSRSLNIYPNPTTGLVNLEYNLDQASAMTVSVTDVVGKVVMSRDLRAASGAQRQTLDLGNLSNGMYLLKVVAGNRQVTRTITLDK